MCNTNHDAFKNTISVKTIKKHGHAIGSYIYGDNQIMRKAANLLEKKPPKVKQI